MTICTEHQDTLWMDVFGELDSAHRPIWEKHLQNCRACRVEKKRLVHLLGQVKTTMETPALTDVQSEALTRSITRRLQQEGHASRWKQWFTTNPQRLIPVLATACIFVVVLSIFSYNQFFKNASMQSTTQFSAQALPAEDLDVIANLEVLKKLDYLQKLEQFVETPPNGDLSTKQPKGTKKNATLFV